MFPRIRKWFSAIDDKKSTWDHKATEWVWHAFDPHDKYTRLLTFTMQVLDRHVRAGKALDVGCGPGLLSEMLAQRGFDVYGTDISERMIEAAVARMASVVDNARLRFRVCTDGEVPFPDMQFDLIAAIQLFPYVFQYTPYIRRLSNLLKPGGIIAATNTNRFSLWAAHEILDRTLRIPPHVRTIRNLARTGYHSGGHVDYKTSQQAYSADRFDALFAAEGFRLIDSMDYYHIGRLDRDPLHRKGLGERLARRLAWHHLGIYQKAGPARS